MVLKLVKCVFHKNSTANLQQMKRHENEHFFLNAFLFGNEN